MPTEQTSNTQFSETLGTKKGFDQMATGFKSAIDEFNDSAMASQYSEYFDNLMATIRPLGDASLRLWNRATRFARRNPVPTAVCAVAVGLVIAGLVIRSSTAKTQVPREI